MHPGHRVTPLLITAHLSDAIVYSGDLLHLDGILSCGVYLGMTPTEQRQLPDLREAWAADLPLPLARWRCMPVGDFDDRLLDDGQLWGWVASVELLPWASFGHTEYRKRPPMQEMLRYTSAKTVNIGSGRLKAYDLALPMVRAMQQQWYCEGDKQLVQEALNRVEAIGRKHNTGYGTVREWQVEPTDARRCPRVYPATGVTLADGGGEFYERGARIRPPYHHRSRAVSRCLVPEVS
jgi:hypothetical protein